MFPGHRGPKEKVFVRILGGRGGNNSNDYGVVNVTLAIVSPRHELSSHCCGVRRVVCDKTSVNHKNKSHNPKGGGGNNTNNC